MVQGLPNIFDFILLKLSSIYVSKLNNEKFDDVNSVVASFNRKNNFDQLKLNLYPYLITMGNGHKEELLSFFDSGFFYTSTGIFHRLFYNISSLGKSENLTFSFTDTSINITNCSPSFLDNFSHHLEKNDNNFEKALVESLKISEHPEVLTYINKSINSINNKYPDHFVIGNRQDLLNLNRINSGFLKLENSIKLAKDIIERRKLEQEFNERIKYERSSLEVS